MRNKRVRCSTVEIEEAAKGMRAAMTHSEKIVWGVLRRRQVSGLKFRDQHAVGRFIFDFYCPELKLVIEIDGASHSDREEIDKHRDREIEQNIERLTFGIKQFASQHSAQKLLE